MIKGNWITFQSALLFSLLYEGYFLQELGKKTVMQTHTHLANGVGSVPMEIELATLSYYQQQAVEREM